MATQSKTQKYKAAVNENERLISQLPDDIVLSSILSCLTIKEVARTRLVSRHWNCCIHHISVFYYENSSAAEKIDSNLWVNGRFNEELIEHERRNYVNCVNHVVGKHVGSVFDEFKLAFELNKNYQSDIDKWVVCALAKHVKKLELDFSLPTAVDQEGSEHNRYVLNETLLEYCFRTIKIKPLLTCLCLKRVNVTSQAVEQLLVSCCNTLEYLFIERSEHLTSIKAACNSSLQSLKYLEVHYCMNLETIDISAPKLLSFKYGAGPPNPYGSGLRLLRIENASSLSHVFIQVPEQPRMAHALCSLSDYLSQLEYLKLQWALLDDNMEIESCPVLENLKHLELWVNGSSRRTLTGWIPLIEACPLLQKLTLKIKCWDLRLWKNVVKRDKHPFLCLKTLEIIGFVGWNIDLGVANFVLENGAALQELILQPRPNFKGSLADLKIPRGVKLIVGNNGAICATSANVNKS